MSLLATACGTTGSGSAASQEPIGSPPASFAPATVRLLTHDAFALTPALLDRFRDRTGLTVQIVTAGDAGEVVNRAVLSAGNPEADVLFGVDTTLLSRAVGAGVLAPYRSAAADTVPADLRDPAAGDLATPVDVGDVCVNVDTRWFTAKGLTPPKTLDDLVDPRYRGLLVVQNPATSSPGLAFLMATVARYGDGWADWWAKARANDVRVVSGWTEAYTGEFTGGGGRGSRPLVVSYGTSPAAEVAYATDGRATATTSVMTDGCFRQVEYAGVLRGTKQPLAAAALVDFLLSPEVQADVPGQMFVYPARSGVPLPDVFRFAVRPTTSLSLPAERIAADRESWVETWTRTVLR